MTAAPRTPPAAVTQEARRRRFEGGIEGHWGEPATSAQSWMGMALLAVLTPTVLVVGFVQSSPPTSAVTVVLLVSLLVVTGVVVTMRRSQGVPLRRDRAAVWLFPGGVVVTKRGRVTASYDLVTDLVRIGRWLRRNRHHQWVETSIEFSRDGVHFDCVEPADPGPAALAIETASTGAKRDAVLTHLRSGGEFDANVLVLDGCGVRHGSTRLAYDEIHRIRLSDCDTRLFLATPYADLDVALGGMIESDLVLTLILELSPALREQD